MDKKMLICIIGGIISLIGIILLLNLNKNQKEPSFKEPVETLESISFVDDTLDLIVGEEYELVVEFIPENLSEEVSYSSSNPSIISVNNEGVIKALKPGESIITATSLSGRSSLIRVTSEEVVLVDETPYIDVSNIVISENEIVIQSGKTYIINAKVLPENASNRELIWETNDSRIATVTDDGVVTGRMEGKTSLTAYAENGKSNSVNVVVKSPNIELSDIELSPSTISLEPGDNYQLKTTFIPSNVSNVKINYSSSNSNIVKVSNTGLITAVSKGSSVITASSNGVSSNMVVTVVERNTLIEVTNISINNNNLNLKVAETSTLSAIVMPINATNKSYVWSSSNSNVVTVSNNGVVKAINKGTATITATTTNGKKATVNITVIENPTIQNNNPTEILLSISSVKLRGGETKQVKATVLPFTSSQEVEWISGSPSIATVNSNGVITGIKNGTTTIAAMTKNGLVARVKVTVLSHDEYRDSNGNKCVTPYTCFKQGDYGGNFCSTANCGPISSKGCSVTSWSIILSMFVSSENGKAYNPLEVASIMTGNGLCSRYCSGDTAAKKVFEYFGLEVSETYKTKSANDRKELIKHLKEGNPALIRVGPGCYTNVGHIMAILAINDEGKVWLSDPATDNKKGRNEWVSLDEIVNCCGSSSWFMLVGPNEN